MHLYLHVPFCARRCTYCDFAIAVRREVPSEVYTDLVLAEWRRWVAEPPWSEASQLSTLYLGGGTPSLLAGDALRRIIDSIAAERPLAREAEVTLEANPEDVTLAAARVWKEAGVNRVSLGVQSFAPAVLAWMHRSHDPTRARTAVQLLREAGVDNISLDLIFALPEALERDWERDLDLALELEPEHLSLYGLTVESHTPLGRQVARGETQVASEERYAAEFLAAHQRLVAAGFRHYEVSNYARPGREAVHNAAYWQRAPFLGLGPSAHSATEGVRWWNFREWSAWRDAMLSGASAVAHEERLGAEEVRLERLYLGLRTDYGVGRGELPQVTLHDWRRAGWAELTGDRVRLTAEGWLRLDALAVDAASRTG